MKAYQLKITLRDSHPPIWRRIIVPAGLSFSQLTLIINTVMDWCGYHMSEYTFHDLGIILSDDYEPDDDLGFSEYEMLDAKEYIIDTFFDKAKKFKYVYDFGDYWQHDVQIEKVLTDYSHNYPMVVKYKGETPLEDCGGIYGWYELLKTLSDPDSPDYEDMKEWADEQAKDDFDMDLMNNDLEHFALTDEESEPKTRSELYEDHVFNEEPFKRIVPKEEEREPEEDDSDIPDSIKVLIEKQQKMEEQMILEAFRKTKKSFHEVLHFLQE